jgi:HrpA-like RNA helicase
MHLPIHDHEAELVQMVNNNPVVIVVGQTGSGKTTHIPLFLLSAGYGRRGMIGVTEPRRLPTTQVAEYVAMQRNVDIGGEVGYQIRHDNTTSPGTCIKFMTEGILLREMLDDPDLLKYEVIMVDEAHEASTNQVLILGLLRSLLSRRPDLKLIIASATVDSSKYSKHFGDAPVLEIEGRVHDVDVIYEPVSFGKSYMHKIASLVRKIHHDRQDGDILVFLTGEDDILATAELIKEMNLSIVVCPLYAQLSPAEQADALKQYKKRKVILATNIAEAGITPLGIKYIIDSGLIKQYFFDPKTGFGILEVVKHSQAGCTQRAGRTGRLSHGQCYRLYSERDFLARPEFSTSDITRDSVASLVLYLKGMGINDPENYPLLERPDHEHIQVAHNHLVLLGAFSQDKKLTSMGKQMLVMPIEPRQARQVLAGIELSCAEAVITIVAMISVGKSPFIRPARSDEFACAEVALARKRYAVAKSDHLTLLNIYNKWQEAGGSELTENWYEDNWLNQLVLVNAQKIVEQIKSVIGKTYKKGLTHPATIIKAMAVGLTDNVCKKSHTGQLTHLKTRIHVGLHNRSDLSDKVSLMVVEELITNQRENGRVKACICSEILPEWVQIKFEKNQKRKKRF